MVYRKLFILLMCYFFLACFASAQPAPDVNITLLHPLNATDCYVPHTNNDGEPYVDFSYFPYFAFDDCQIFTNSSGVFEWRATDYSISAQSVNKFNQSIGPGSYLWGVRCIHTDPGSNIHWSENWSLLVTDAPYCAVLSETTCNIEAPKWGKGHFQTRLTNTNGLDLENQDCEVILKNSRGEIEKVFDTLTNSKEGHIQLDENGNWFNTGTKLVPLTNSKGYYNFEFDILGDWVWVGDEFTIETVCNGQITSCKFNVTNIDLPDDKNAALLGKKASSWVILFVLVIFFMVILYKKLRRVP